MADTPRIPREDRIRALSGEGWDAVRDRVIHGLSHTLLGRASSLSGLTFLLESGTEDTAPVLGLLGQELEHLEAAVALLRLLPDDSEGPELVAPTTLMPELVKLVQTQRGLENIEFTLEAQPEAPAVRGDPTFLTRSLLLLMTGAAEAALLAGESTVVIRLMREEESLVLEMKPGFPSSDEGAVDPGILPKRLLSRARMEGISEVLEGGGIGVEGFDPGEGPGGLRLYFPPVSLS